MVVLCSFLKNKFHDNGSKHDEIKNHLRNIIHRATHINQFVNKKQQAQFNTDISIVEHLKSVKDILICKPD